MTCSTCERRQLTTHQLLSLFLRTERALPHSANARDNGYSSNTIALRDGSNVVSSCLSPVAVDVSSDLVENRLGITLTVGCPGRCDVPLALWAPSNKCAQMPKSSSETD